MESPGLADARTGLSAQNAGRRLVADVDRARHQVAEAVHDPTGAQAGVVTVVEADARVHAEAAAMEVVEAALAPGRGRGRSGERNGAERGDSSGGENELADHGGLSSWVGCAIASSCTSVAWGPQEVHRRFTGGSRADLGQSGQSRRRVRKRTI